MRKITSLTMTSLLVLSLQMSAQTTMLSTDMMSTNNGLTAIIYASTGVLPGNSGANRTWDFSNLSIVNSGTISIISPTGMPGASQYPASNYCYKMIIGANTYYSYLNLTTNLFTILYDGTSGKSYNPGKSQLKFPFNFNDSVVDANYDFYRKYDGYGTFKINGETYTNVIRIKTQFTGESPSYLWYLTSPLRPLANLESGTMRTFIYNDIISSVKSLAINPLEIYPNPANGFITIKINDNQKSIISIFNNLGELVLQKQVIAHKNVVDISNLSKGVYIIKVSGMKGIKLQKLIKE